MVSHGHNDFDNNICGMDGRAGGVGDGLHKSHSTEGLAPMYRMNERRTVQLWLASCLQLHTQLVDNHR